MPKKKSQTSEVMATDRQFHRARKGERFILLRDQPMIGLTSWGTAYTGSFDCVLPANTVLIAEIDQPRTASAFPVSPERYKEYETKYVPEIDRTQSNYGGYYFVLSSSDIDVVYRQESTKDALKEKQ